jgi:hypothetical protein
MRSLNPPTMLWLLRVKNRYAENEIDFLMVRKSHICVEVYC